jgi:hypothetical protein
MKPGTFIRLPDGREGTVVYHGLDGYGIMFGRIAVDVDAINGTQPLFGEGPKDWPYSPDALLRKPWPTAKMECVGDEYEIVE